ncbi:hypothetical protein [Streptomyces sp. NPDC047108]|uniref:hypothetical protein n=1 Tax=Streptomyces sp. NPDC047108 TaxID=3155025 RepID=UPI0033DA3C2E
MGIETFLRNPSRSDDEPAVDPGLQEPGSFSLSTQLMQDAVPAEGVEVGDGSYNQEALFSNPFKEGREEALVVNRKGQITYLERTDSSVTGWLQEPVEAPLVAEVVVAVHPSGDVWAICSPKDENARVFGLVLTVEQHTPEGTARCKWTGMATFNQQGIAARGLCVSYAQDGGALVLGTSLANFPGRYSNLVLMPRLPEVTQSGSQDRGGWVLAPTRVLNTGRPVVGGGYLPFFSASGKPYTFVYYRLDGKTLIRIEEREGEGGHSPVYTVSTAVEQFCGAFHQPYLNRNNPQGDVGFAYLDAKGALVTGYFMSPGHHLVTTSVNAGFVSKTKLWQDADGKLHVFGINAAGSLQVLHQSGWQTVKRSVGSDTAQVLEPTWTQARVAGAPSGIGGCDLARTNDRIVAFDYTRSGKSDHLLVYRPGTPPGDHSVWVVKRTSEAGGFSRTFASGEGLPGYDFRSSADRVIAYDYTGSGSADHLLAYRPGAGKFAIFKKQEKADLFDLVASSASDGIGGCNLADPRDRLVPFDWLGRKNFLLAYRPGAGRAWVLGPQGDGSFSTVFESSAGLGGFTLSNEADQVVGFDYDSSGGDNHLLAYRPGAGTVYVLSPWRRGGGFDAVIHNDTGGISPFQLNASSDRLIPFDYTGLGKNDHLLAYRPGPNRGDADQTVYVFERNAHTNTYQWIEKSADGLGGYDFASTADQVIGYDYNGTGGLSYLVAYRPGAGRVSVMGQRGGKIGPVYQAPPPDNRVPVTVGLHADVVDYQLEPYPDYKAVELIKLSRSTPAEAYRLYSQDVTTSRWETDKVRLPQDPGKAPHIVSNYVADATLLSKQGKPMPGHHVSVSADSLVEVQINSISYQVGPGREVEVATNEMGKLVLSVPARGLNPPVVHLDADGLEAGTAIDFASKANSFLAGKGSLPSQRDRFTPDLLEHARCTPNAPGMAAEPLADWAALKKRGLTPRVVVDHCANLYGQAAGDKQLKPVLFDGLDEPQPVFGYVIQLWDPGRPAYQAFRTQADLDAYKAYRDAHPTYTGWWEDFTSWANDVWEGIKTGATQVAEVIVTTVTEIAVWVGNVIVSLGEMVVEAIEQAVQAVEAVFQMVAKAVVRVIDWLKSLFAFKDIWNTKMALEDGVKSVLAPYATSTFRYYAKTLDNWFKQQEAAVDKWLRELTAHYPNTRMGDLPNSIPPLPSPTGGTIDRQDLDTPQGGWFLNKTVASGSEGQGILLTEQIRPMLEDVASEFKTFLEFLLGNEEFNQTLNSLGNLDELPTSFFSVDDTDPSSRSELSVLVAALRTMVHSALAAADAIIQKLLFLLQYAAQRMGALLNTPLDLGPVNTLYAWVQKKANPDREPEPMTVGGLGFLIAAFYATTGYKLIMGVDKAPFPDGKFPPIPPPPWHLNPAERASGNPTDLPPIAAVSFQVTSIGKGVLEGITTPFTDYWGVMELTKGEIPSWAIACSLSVDVWGTLLALPPIVKDKPDKDDWPLHGLFALSSATLVFDLLGVVVGKFVPITGNRSNLLKNLGAANKIIQGSAVQFLMGLASLVFGCVIASRTVASGAPPGRAVAAWVGAIMGRLPWIAQIARAIAQTFDFDPETRQIVYIVTSLFDGAVALGGGLNGGINAAIELGDLPGLDGAQINQSQLPYTIQARGGRTIVNTPLKWKMSTDPEDAPLTIEPKKDDPAKAVLKSTAPLTQNTTCHITITDNYGPPVSAQADITIQR